MSTATREPDGDAAASGSSVADRSAADRAREDEVEASRRRVRQLTGVEPERTFDHERIRTAVRMLLEAIGEDPDRPGIADTPDRVARALDEILAGLLVDPRDVLSVTFDEAHDEIVMMRDIPFHSLCEHHLVPFVGEAHVAYLPGDDGRVTGLSKLARVVDLCARRPGLQERLTTTIADVLEEALQPKGVMVVIEARHFCMEMRGVRKPGALTVTSAVRGRFRADPATRAEAMALLKGGTHH